MTDREPAAPPAEKSGEPPAEQAAPDPVREALLADPELPAETRERLAAIEGGTEFARAWRDSVVEQTAAAGLDALRDGIREELAAEQAEELDRIRAAQHHPTRALAGAPPPPAEPASSREWADWIHESDDPSERDLRRDRFADWLRRHPGA